MGLFRPKNDLATSVEDLFRLESDRVRSNQDRVPSAKAVLPSAADRVRSDGGLFRSIDDLLGLAVVVVRW
jgi:hypothetical protein